MNPIDKMTIGATNIICEEIDRAVIFNTITKGWYKMEIRFGKDRYHEQKDMEEWCHNNIGPGCWTYGTPLTWKGMGNNLWVVNSIFGSTTFAFKNPKDLTLFILRWA
jgi:hypothetical protein